MDDLSKNRVFEDKYTLDKIKNIQHRIRQYNDHIDLEDKKTTILYVDDEQRALSTFKATFRRDFTIHTANSPEEGRALLTEQPIEIILTDQRMEKETGIEFLTSIRESHPEIIKILITGYADVEPIIQAINEAKVYRYVSKPYHIDDMKQTIKKAAEVLHLRRAQKELVEIALEANQQLEFMLRERLNML